MQYIFKRKRQSDIFRFRFITYQIQAFNVDHKYFLSESLSRKVKRASALPD